MGHDTHIFEEDFEYTTSLFIDQTRNTFYTTTTGKTADSGLCNALDVVSQNLPVTLSSTLSESFSTLDHSALETEDKAVNFCGTYFSASRHCWLESRKWVSGLVVRCDGC